MCDEMERKILATAQGLGSITYCSCGTISLNVGGVSVRMEPGAFAQTAEMCRIAIAALEVHAQALQTAALGLSSMTH